MFDMLYLIDGYNVTHRDPETSGLTLREQREALEARLRVRGREMLGGGRIVVVFDGQGGPGVSTGGSVPVELVYSHEGTADDEIVKLAKRTRDSVTLITADRGLVERAKAQAGARLTARDSSCCFEAAGKGAARKNRARGSMARETGQPVGGNAITKELKDLWLTGENEKDD